MNKRNVKDPNAQGRAIPRNPEPVQDAMRDISKENEDLNPDADLSNEGPGQPPEGAGAEVTGITSHSGQTTRGSYATDSSTGTGRYQDHTTGTFGMDPLDEQVEDAVDPLID